MPILDTKPYWPFSVPNLEGSQYHQKDSYEYKIMERGDFKHPISSTGPSYLYSRRATQKSSAILQYI